MREMQAPAAEEKGWHWGKQPEQLPDLAVEN